MLNIRNFGSLYLDGRPVEAGAEYRWERRTKEILENPIPRTPSIAIGNTDPDHPIGWFPVGKILVPTEDLLIGVSWRDLDANGLASAKSITIDGLPYQLRLFKIGKTYNDPGEWGQFAEFVAEQGLDPNLSNCDVWADSPAWKFENAHPSIGVDLQSLHFRCGPVHAGTWDRMAWRPVLEPICVKLSPDLLGQRLGVWTKTQELVSGLLTSLSDYDITLSNGECNPTEGTWKSLFVRKSDESIVVDRTGISSVQIYADG